jgi:hypothetical protein
MPQHQLPSAASPQAAAPPSVPTLCYATPSQPYRKVNPEAVSSLKKRGVKVTVLEGNPASARVLDKAGVGRADSVVLCGLHRMEPKQADAQVGVQCGWGWGPVWCQE